MGQQHNELRRGPWSKALKNAVGDSRQDGGVERYGETMTPIANLWTLDRPDWAALRDEILFHAFRGVTAVAGEFSIVALENAGASTLVIVDEAFGASGTAAGAIRFRDVRIDIGVTNIKATTSSIAGPLMTSDTRVNPQSVSGVPSVVLWAGTDPGGFTDANDEMLTSIASGDIQSFRSPPLILRPGTMAIIESDIANQGLFAGFRGRVRPMQSTEDQTWGV